MTRKEMEKKIEELEEKFANHKFVRTANEIWNVASVKNANNVTVQELASYVLDGKPIVRDAQQIVYANSGVFKGEIWVKTNGNESEVAERDQE